MGRARCERLPQTVAAFLSRGSRRSSGGGPEPALARGGARHRGDEASQTGARGGLPDSSGPGPGRAARLGEAGPAAELFGPFGPKPRRLPPRRPSRTLPRSAREGRCCGFFRTGYLAARSGAGGTLGAALPSGKDKPGREVSLVAFCQSGLTICFLLLLITTIQLCVCKRTGSKTTEWRCCCHIRKGGGASMRRGRCCPGRRSREMYWSELRPRPAGDRANGGREPTADGRASGAG